MRTCGRLRGVGALSEEVWGGGGQATSLLRDDPNRVSESTVSNTELSQFFPSLRSRERTQ